jgi:hypothetical protein
MSFYDGFSNQILLHLGIYVMCDWFIEHYRALIFIDVVDLVFWVWFACVEWDVDASLFLRTVASPETLNGQNRWEPGLEHCLCVLEVLTIAG